MASAQGLSPSSPTQELIYFGGRLIAIEERGPGGTTNAVAAATPATTTTGSAGPASPASYSVAPPPQPTVSVPPRDTTSGAGRPVATPDSTKVFVVLQP